MEHQRLDEQGDLVIQGFRKLIQEYSGPIVVTYDRAALAETMLSLSKDEDGMKDMAIDHLQLHGPRSVFLAACLTICRSLQSATELVEQTKLTLSPGNFTLRRPHGMADDLEVAILLIDSIIKLFGRSDGDLAMEHWECVLQDIDITLEQILPSEPGTDDESETSQCQCEPAARLTKLLIPLLKLSRVFFNKLTLCGINTKPPILHRDGLRPNEIFRQGTQGSGNHSHEHLLSFDGWTSRSRIGRRSFVLRRAHQMGRRAQALLILVLLYLIPSILDTDGFPAQNYYRNRFKTWNTLLILATKNFTNFARSVDDDPL
ncbi:hypothetical protein MJO28_003874 [Puccinia striiformis f. sp. tritici]|uniref:Uncharacterized protein n=1 Tax=Puccinia striiformis f. sp. tritici TaxID=168172 RepID=A0ACC0EMC3_9BASI|nr:hypothetical protein MJO28_003874 [Puccinia striiformis f. sp. tritici]